jgi:hypothetical protein
MSGNRKLPMYMTAHVFNYFALFICIQDFNTSKCYLLLEIMPSHHHQPTNVPTARAGLSYGLHIRRKDHNPPGRPSVDWWVLTTANVARSRFTTSITRYKLMLSIGVVGYE